MSGARPAPLRAEPRRPPAPSAPLRSAPSSPLRPPRHGAGVGGGRPAEPLPGRLCGKPGQVPAQAGHMGG